MLAKMHPLERLLNLVALLLDTNRPLTFEQIRTTLPAYDQDDKASAKRQFERDKDTLRGIGIPVETVPTDAWEVEEGYRIPKERYELPDVSFTAEEVAALFVAAHAPGEDGQAAQAFQ
jgi:predicted DNA-binding transcriptional regulator YafY